MKKIQVLLLLMLLSSPLLFAQKMIGTETDAQKEQRMAWWKDARFGMFIHFGLYSGVARH